MLPRRFSKTPEYACWRSIKDRCTNSKHESFKYYGGRGIGFCKRWLKFENFLADVGPRPSKQHSIDRYPNNDGDYRPKNVRWATRQEQQANTRRTRKVAVQGKTLPLPEACRILGLNIQTVRGRIRDGWNAQDAINKPIRRKPILSASQRAEIRTMTGITQQEIGRRYGITQAAVSEIKLGRRKRNRRNAGRKTRVL